MLKLELREIKKAFGHTIALAGVNLGLKKGEVHALIGENGAGKSTLMNIISGALQPDSGTLYLDGELYAPANPMDARRNRIALIHQELSLVPHLTVAENILLGVENSSYGWLNFGRINARAEKVLASFGHFDIGPDELAGELSTASQQVIEICRALAADAEIILMDEPTSSLQGQDVNRLFEVIRTLCDRQISIIYISHFLEEIREIADSFTVMRDGKSVATGETANVDNGFLISQMVGRSIDNLYPVRKPSSSNSATVLSAAGLKGAGFIAADFQLKQGEILGIAGLIGSGRSELLKAIFGLERAEMGTFSFKNQSVEAASVSPVRQISNGFGLLCEDRKREGLSLDLSIADNITMTRFDSCSAAGFINLGTQRKQAEQLLGRCSIKASNAAQSVGELSGGNQQKAAIARLVHQEAQILLLDEPTRGVDVASKAKIYEIISQLAAEGKSVIMVSSYLPELFGICDRLAVMCKGRLSEARPVDEWTPELVMKTAIGTDE